MKILTLNYEFPPLGGGGGVACEQVAVELVRLGHQVDVVTSQGPGTVPDETRDGVHITRVPVWGRGKKQTASLLSMLTFVKAATRTGRQMAREFGYDLVHTHFAVPTGPAGVKVARTAGLPLVLSVHGGDLFDPTKLLSPHRWWPIRRVVRGVLNAADLVIAQSSNTAENARRYYGFRGPLEIIPLGIPPAVFNPASRDSFGLGKGDFVMITIGRLVRRKGLNYLLDAMAGLPQDNLKLVVCGDGPERDNLERQAKSLKLQNRIVFVGHVTDEQKFQLLSLADLFVMASLHEGFGIIFLEAMSAGLPIVATNVGGQTDFLAHETNALLVPPCDVFQLRAALERAIKDKDLRESMKRNNLEKVKEFSIRRIAEQHLDSFTGITEASKLRTESGVSGCRPG